MKLKTMFLLAGAALIMVFFSNSLLEAASDFVPGELVVQFKEGVSDRGIRRVLSGIGEVETENTYRHSFKILRPVNAGIKEVISRLRKNPAVKYAEPNYIIKAYEYPNDELFPQQWNFSMIDVEDAWDVSTGEGVVVAVLDTGVNPNGHDSFGNRLLPGYNAFLHTEKGWEDGNYHGTHVAGTIAQETNNNIGVAGIAYNALILPVKVLSRFRVGSLASVSDGLYWAADQGVDIINMSLGGGEYSQIFEDAVHYAYDKGIILIAASGNEASSVGYPAAFENVVAVGAVGCKMELAFYSNFGPEIDLVAPGGDSSQSSMSDTVVQETFREFLGFRHFAIGWRYRGLSGTSMATPHVSGVAALIKSIHPEWTPDEVKDALTETAVDLGPTGKDDDYGYGLLNAYEAVTYSR